MIAEKYESNHVIEHEKANFFYTKNFFWLFPKIKSYSVKHCQTLSLVNDSLISIKNFLEEYFIRYDIFKDKKEENLPFEVA